MKVAVIYNKKTIDPDDVINISGFITKEHYSPKAIELVASSLEKGGHTVKTIEGNMSAMQELNGFMPKVVSGERPGLVFNMAYGIQGHGRYTHVPAMLEMLGVPYVGSGPEAHAVVQDKVMTKIVLQKNNLPTPGYWVFSSADDKFDDLIFPVIVKPKMESTSMGMQIVDSWEDLQKAVKDEIDKYQQDALVEQFIPGREFAVGLIGNGNQIDVLPIVEFDLQGDPNKIQTKSAKMEHGVEKICPADLPEDVAKEMKRICVDAFRKLGVKDYTRVDLRMDKDGHVYILELNSMASLGKGGSFFYSAKKAGYTYESFINKILDVAAIRYFGESQHQAPKIADEEAIRSQPLRVAARSYLRSHLRTTLQFLKYLVNTNTNVRQIDSINNIGNLISRRLKQLGFKEHVIQKFDIGNIYYFTNHEDGLANDVLLLAHIDTPYSTRDFVGYREERNKIYGSGIAESKGGIAVMLSALHALRFARKLKKVKIGIVLTSDDSLGGLESKSIVEAYSKNSKYVIGLKWGVLDGSVITSCLGRDDYQIEIANIRDSFQPRISDIIPTVCKKIIAINKLAKKDSLISIRSMQANASFGRSPDHATISLVTNFATKSQGTELDKQIKAVLKKREMMKLDVEVTRRSGRDPFVQTKDSSKLFDIIKEQAERIDLKLHADSRRISSDVSYVPDGIPVIEGMGPQGSEFRTPNEYILRDSLIDRALLLVLVLFRCAKKE